jgi:hypothetical protein
MLTILLAGQARVGKTTAATYIAERAKKKFDFKVTILPFAKAIKDAAIAAGLSKEMDPIGYRSFCQTIGEEKRAANPNYWIDQFKDAWNLLCKSDEEEMNDPTELWQERLVIVDDCRYMNELAFGKSIGAIAVFISNGGRALDGKDAEWRKHESEQLANEIEAGNAEYGNMFDWLIKNNGDVDDFHMKLDERMLSLLRIDPVSYAPPCDCIICTKFKKDEALTVDELMRDFMGDDDDGA